MEVVFPNAFEMIANSSKVASLDNKYLNQSKMHAFGFFNLLVSIFALFCFANFLNIMNCSCGIPKLPPLIYIYIY